ncbi:ABC transporter permease [Spirilliplanes yamanashiensis]|uniref:Xylose transport system permease protein XylH n=1 Tax=Spirilliplanes yamanashiensis TaxID=42233 RepID=A0A8J4DKL4_9ACTN|nr:ABC transporter permease [Spirilliplanes yamanashiensis]MDP9817584.1 simple sugar transport system permease protein [Spirilliplanes yamanashiensis]GIJ04394.1 ribose ABC transporter permease [Spirilliplanes yamanashiensis]
MTATLTAPPARGDERLARQSAFSRLAGRPEIGALVGAVVIFILFFVVAPPFREAPSIATVLYQSSLYGIPAVGVALLMIGGEFDLSAGVAVISSSLVASMTAYQLSVNVWVGVLVSLVVALAIGLLNGYLLVRTKLPSFLVTLATFFMLTGLNLALTKLISGGVATKDISDIDGFASAQAIFAQSFDVGGVSLRITLLWWIVFVAIATWVLLKTHLGNWIFAVGGADASARAVGVPVKKVKIGLFMTVSFLCWFTGMHILFSFNTVQSGQGPGNEFLYIIAAVVGGCLLTGGYGSAVGAAIGAFIFGMTEQGIVLAGWEADWFKFFLGAMLLGATLLNVYVRRRAETRK